MAFSKMISLIILLWILPIVNAGGQENHFQTVHAAVNRRWQDQVGKIQQSVEVVYTKQLLHILTKPPTIVVLQKTKASIYILDTCGLLLSYVGNNLIGFQVSHFLNNDFTMWNSEFGPQKQVI